MDFSRAGGANTLQYGAGGFSLPQAAKYFPFQVPTVRNSSLPPLHPPFTSNTCSHFGAGFHSPHTFLSSVLHRYKKRIQEQHLSRGTAATMKANRLFLILY